MKESIGIITWCDNNGVTNYGQLLQCYAIQHICEILGFQPIIIQYRKKGGKDFIHRTIPIGYFNQIYEWLYKIFVVEKKYDKRIYLFRKFIRDYIHLSFPCYCREDIERLTRDCTGLICGSDQIWNPVCFDPIYYLDFGHSTQVRLSYAPSGIFKEDHHEFYSKLGKLINKIDYVSVREEASEKILQNYTKNKLITVLDPTLLIERKDWDMIAADSLEKESYIFCYMIGSLRPYEFALKYLMEKYKVKKVVCIPSNLIPIKTKWIDNNTQAGPAEFISLVKHARAVCTDSFHGTAMSVIYKKQFYSFKRVTSMDEEWASSSRIDNLLAKFNIGSRTISCIKDVENMPDIDYHMVNSCLQKEKEKSLNFLKQLLHDTYPAGSDCL